MKKSDYFYELPEELIAQDPLPDRSSSRLMLLDKTSGEISHRHFYELPGFLKEGDELVLNDTRVMPARLYGVKRDTGAVIEVLLLKHLDDGAWETLVRPGKKAKEGAVIDFGEGLLTGTVEGILEEGNRKIRFSFEGIFEEILDKLGEMPLPPYIHHRLNDKERYQTVYAREQGSAAAPTAGLHFTEELLEQISKSGVGINFVTLHVGLGTFRPVKEDDILDHKMHTERCHIDRLTALRLNKAKAEGRRIVCVGTTSVRTLESMADEAGILHDGYMDTDIFIYPGYRFRICDALITNFHLPESTLIMLVSALAGRENVLEAYREAVKERYRFFSFGDAMFIS
ncbi:MAG: tRNA preQ1(34) S-adenosylmethionine ribosyltransferase-isomerase QueA [Lachnospiraceae bacterium]|nr:tRNA preQ1(34) S-adenosylmethionine ribosyltransferase-isomerase QueA [Lachnospiraceae bacterium]